MLECTSFYPDDRLFLHLGDVFVFTFPFRVFYFRLNVIYSTYQDSYIVFCSYLKFHLNYNLRTLMVLSSMFYDTVIQGVRTEQLIISRVMNVIV